MNYNSAIAVCGTALYIAGLHFADNASIAWGNVLIVTSIFAHAFGKETSK